MGKKYKNPPIIEVVCEFRFSPETEWDITVPGLLYEKIRDGFPHKEQRIVQSVEISHTRGEVEHKIHTEERMVFFDTSKKILTQIGPRVLSVNHLKPYSSWENFKPKIERSFKALLKIIHVKELQRIGLRYINKIEIPEKTVNLETYFDFRPFLGSNLPQDIVNFMVGCMLSFNNGRDLCKVELRSAVPDNPESSAFILDLDYFLSQPKTIIADDALNWIENAHGEIEKVFEGCIKDSLRKIFKEV